MESRDWEEISHCDIPPPGPVACRVDECMKCDKIMDRDDVIEQKGGKLSESCASELELRLYR
ncbi:hypothetical protein GOA63_24665 [Sinorhizobium meliloti]|nr:hypothetical protein [Sinorhizobium meliloti]MDX0190980.1 hypothetical protein [Sinorhizobium meliloti]MQV07198.1 hypothetical protein [Sinorhizobium meliloti]MQV63551.1 hypothetical protein [Sinorhizobium meliloti]